MHQEEIALLNINLLSIDGPHDIVIAEPAIFRAEHRLEVQHDAAALYPADSHIFDPQRLGIRAFRMIRAEQMLIRAVTVVVDFLGHTVAIGIELLPHMGKRIPLCGKLGVEHYTVVAHHV